MPKRPENGWSHGHRIYFTVIEQAKIERAAREDRRTVPEEIAYLALEALAWRKREQNFQETQILRANNPELFDLVHILNCIRTKEEGK